MPDYEIHLVTKSCIPSLIYATSEPSDEAAIQAARRRAPDGDRIEVWRGLKCIYREHSDAIRRLRTRARPDTMHFSPLEHSPQPRTVLIPFVPCHWH